MSGKQILASEAALLLDRGEPENDIAKPGSRVRDLELYAPVVLIARVTADATGGLAVEVPFPMEVDIAFVEARATVSTGTLTLRKGSSAITDAITCNTDQACTSCGMMVAAQEVLAEGDALNVVANLAAVRGKVTIYGHRI